MSELQTALQEASQVIQEHMSHPHGIPAAGETRTLAGQACVRLCDGDQDRARTLWKLITSELGYMPLAAAVALIRASNTTNLVPDIPAPDLDAVPR